MAADAMADIRDVFFQECEEQLAELETGLLRMESGQADAETVNAVFRAVHSIKGGAGIFALDALVRFAHVFETCLDLIRIGQLTADPPVISLLLRAADTLTDLVGAARHGAGLDGARLHDSAAELDRLAAGGTAIIPQAAPAAAVSVAERRTWIIRLAPKASLYAHANETALLLRELSLLGAMEVELDSGALPGLAEMDPEAAYLVWTVTLTTACDETTIRGVFDFVEDECDLDIFERPDFRFFDAAETAGSAADTEPPPPTPTDNPTAAVAEVAAATPDSVGNAGATIRVDLDRVDRMIDLVGELVITEAMVSQRVLEAGLARTSAIAMALEELEGLTRDIQDSVMAIRALPVRAVFQRMPRLVRELAAHTGKPVRLIIEGESTEVDKTVIERIADPLTHMIRNAIDHGLELPAARIAAGKPVEGLVRLAALHRSGRIIIEVSDDGAGIDRARVRRKAIEKGLLSADAQLSDDETDNLIFLPGFSTASAVSDISGRGVGLDVVRRSVQAMGGRITITSRPGQGSTFTLSLPLTLAVLDGMVVKTARQTLIVPLASVLETLRPNVADIYPLDNRSAVLALRGGYVPIVDIAEALEISDRPTRLDRSVALLVESEGGSRAVLLVDEIEGQKQVVIKSIEANYRAVYGIAAATVMGDGHVALILDVDAVVSAKRDAARPDVVRAVSQVF